MRASLRIESLPKYDCKGTLYYQKLCAWFPLRPVQTEPEYVLSVKVMQELLKFANKHEAECSGDKDYAELIKFIKALGTLIGDYERTAYPDWVKRTTKGHEALAFLMEQGGLKQSDLSKELGGQSVVSSILSGRRFLNLKQIKALAKRFGVSPAVFF